MMKRVLAIGLAAALSACTSYQMVPAGGVEFTGKDEVRRKGFAVGAVVDSKLTLVHYYGTEMYHFQKNSADAEQVVAAFRFKNKG